MLVVVCGSVVQQMCVTVYCWCDLWQYCVTSVCAGCDVWQCFMTACDCGPLVWPVAVLRDQSLCDCVCIWRDRVVWQACVTVSTFDMTCCSVVWQVLLCLHLTWHVAVLCDKCFRVYIWHDPWQCCVTSFTVSTFDMTCGYVAWQVYVTVSTFAWGVNVSVLTVTAGEGIGPMQQFFRERNLDPAGPRFMRRKLPQHGWHSHI